MVSLSKPVPVRRHVATAARRSRGKKTAAQKRTGANAANGFLKHRFLPLRADCHAELNDRKLVEREFFSSLSNLATLYGMKALPKNNTVYPCNIANAFKHMQKQLKILAPSVELAIIQDDNHAATLVTYREYSLGNCLYYIPVRPLWDLLRQTNKKQEAELLKSVFAYLLQVVNMPSFAEWGSYLYYEYQMLWEWYSEDESMMPENWQVLSSSLRSVEICGGIIGKKMKNPVNLALFGKRLAQFLPTDQPGKDFKQIATGFYNLYQKFPQRSFWDSIHTGLSEPEVENRVMAGQYLSFVWDTADCLFDDVMQSINAQLEECMVMDSPLVIQFFDTPQTEIALDLEFEHTLFALLDGFFDILNQLK